MEKEQLIGMAKSLVDRELIEGSIKADINQYIDYQFSTRINFSIICSIHYDIFREKKNKTQKLKAMTIIELIVLASDIMDDMQDGDTQDFVPWSSADHPHNYNIVLGIILMCVKEVGEFEGKFNLEQTTMVQLILRSISGQHIDLRNNITNEDEYIHMCSMKSGSIIALACLLGAGDVKKSLAEKIINYSNLLGVIFQLRNDTEDMKKGFIKNDLVYMKRTLPILYYLNTDDSAYENIQSYYNNGVLNSNFLELHKDLINGDALLYCHVVEKLMLRKFEQTINQLTLSKSDKNKLLTIVSNGLCV